jgi:hypothetical protein
MRSLGLASFPLSNSISYFVFRINKRGSQKDAEQKRNGNYFFYDEGGDDDEDDIDDDDL